MKKKTPFLVSNLLGARGGNNSAGREHFLWNMAKKVGDNNSAADVPEKKVPKDLYESGLNRGILYSFE